MLNGTSSGSFDVDSLLASAADPNRPGWSRMSVTEGVRAVSIALLIVLMDSFVGSSGENFVEYLGQLENVVFVGTNTRGCMLTGNLGVFTLPNSKIGLSCGTKISICENLSNPDGRGLMPDLWVRPDEAVDRAVKYIWAGAIHTKAEQ